MASLLLINYLFHLLHTAAIDLFLSGLANICNNDLSNPNCNERTTDSAYRCAQLSPSNPICACIPPEPTQISVIVIIDASNHTKQEWQSVTLKWLKLYYDSINSSNATHNMRVYYMLSHGDFTLTSLDNDPLFSELGSQPFIDNLNDLSKPNACVAFKRAKLWLANNDISTNDTAIIYYAKTTPFAPGFPYHCQNENELQSIHSNKMNIFAIKYLDYINLNYVQRDIGEFAYEMSIFPNTFNNQLINGINIDSNSNITLDYIASYIVSEISDFVCNKHIAQTDQESIDDLIVSAPNTMVDCCSYASGTEYSDINTCDMSQIQGIEHVLVTQNCLLYCNPFQFYAETTERNWECITNYAHLVQLSHSCDGLDVINMTLWNDYRWHCPMCYNVSVDSYNSVCRSNDGKEEILDVYISENCDCKDLTLFLVVIIEIAALLFILIGMFILWYRFNVIKVKQHIREKRFDAITAINPTEEIELNDANDDIQ